MKFMEAIFTQEGPGVVVARGVDGDEVAVQLAERKVRVEVQGKVVEKTFPGAIRLMRRCAVHGAWFWQRCELCQAQERTDDAGD